MALLALLRRLCFDKLQVLLRVYLRYLHCPRLLLGAFRRLVVAVEGWTSSPERLSILPPPRLPDDAHFGVAVLTSASELSQDLASTVSARPADAVLQASELEPHSPSGSSTSGANLNNDPKNYLDVQPSHPIQQDVPVSSGVQTVRSPTPGERTIWPLMPKDMKRYKKEAVMWAAMNGPSQSSHFRFQTSGTCVLSSRAPSDNFYIVSSCFASYSQGLELASIDLATRPCQMVGCDIAIQKASPFFTIRKKLRLSLTCDIQPGKPPSLRTEDSHRNVAL